VLVLTAAQLRVVNAPRRRTRYLVAWLAATALLGALVSRMDALVGHVGARRIVLNFVFISIVAALAFATCAWWTRRDAWAGFGAAARFLTLAVLNAIVVTATTYLFI
jgi:hypothetical protein